ncbi:MAG: ribosome small subunit-dependent GTPase A, partial [Chloroflexi bacterium]|nr:ribosome small subunit-dependent GTPase A [Chloroflexota bacterium]
MAPTVPPTLTGRVIRTQSGFFTVETDHGNFTCQISGKLKNSVQRSVSKDTEQRGDLVALNDLVTIAPYDTNQAAIVDVTPRRNVLSRVAPGASVGTSAESEKIILANTDQVIIVLAARKPSPKPRALDRLLVIAEKAEIPSIVICITKMDLDKKGQVRETFKLYEEIGYPVYYVSALSEGQPGVDAFRNVLIRDEYQVSVLTGPSGVGKSTLLNALEEGLRLETKSVSDATTKGRHTTRFSQLIKLEAGGYVADTPGIRSIAPWDIEPEELDGYYIEFRPFVERCKFADCSHVHEPGCAVIAAVEAGEISA